MSFVSTNGWDTVYALHFNNVNDAIRTKKSSPASFSEEETDDDGTTRISGAFSDWQLSPGGDGKVINMTLPIPSASLLFLNTTDTLTDISATIELNLSWAADPNSSDNQDLTSDTSDVKVISLNGANITEVRQARFRTLLEKWLRANNAGFQHVFASVVLNDVADKEDFQWLKPTGNPSYAVADTESLSLEKSVFAVLCMTGDRPSPATHEVSPNAIPEGANSGFLLAPQRVIEHIFKPYVYLLFNGATPEDFAIENNGLSIQNKNDVSFGPQEIDGHGDVTPTVAAGNFQITLRNTRVEFELTAMNFEWSPGINVEVYHRSEGVIGLNEHQALTLTVSNGETSANVNTSTDVLIGEIVGGIAGALVGAAIGAFIGSAVSGGAAEVVSETTAQVEKIAMETIDESVGEEVSNVEYKAMDEAMKQIEQQIPEEDGTGGTGQPPVQQSGKFATFFATHWAKILGAVIGTVVGTVVAEIPAILGDVAENNGEGMKMFDEFGMEALSSVSWPNTSADGFTLKSLQLNEALQFGIDLSFTTAAKSGKTASLTA